MQRLLGLIILIGVISGEVFDHSCFYTGLDGDKIPFTCPNELDELAEFKNPNKDIVSVQLECLSSIRTDWYSSLSGAELAHNLRFVNCEPSNSIVAAESFKATAILKSLEITRSKDSSNAGVWKFESGSLSTLKRTLRTLKLNNLGLSDNTRYEIPDLSVLISTSLIDLDLSFNTISSLDGLVDRDRCNLERLVLDHNELETIDSPKFWSKCSKLTYFSATHNQLNSAQGLKHRGSLKSLILDFNKFVHLPDIPDSLKELSISNNIIQRYQQSYGNGLTKLNISHNQLDSIKSFTYMQQSSIIVADFSHNHINSLDHKHFDSSSLESINLSHNQITKMSNDVFYRLPKIKHVDISYNQRKFLKRLQVSESIFQNITGVKSLNLAGNSLSSGAFKEIMHLLGDSLQQLNVSDCQLNKIDDHRRRNQQLVSLDISHNPIEADEKTTDAIARYDHLAYLDASFTNLEQGQFNLKNWGDLLKLRYLNLSHSNISILMGMFLPSSIEILDISYNNIRSFNIERKVNLKELYLANNKLNEVPIDIKDPSKSIFKLSPKLSLLDLSHNQIRNVSNFLFELNHEKRKEYPKVKLVGNPLKCDCDSTWMAANSSYEYRTVPTRKDKHRVVIDRYLPIIEDRNKVTCQQLWQLNTGKSVIKPISEVEGQYYLCAHLVHGPKYFANPNKAPNCEWNAKFYVNSPSICDERSVCPATRPNSPKCYCFHNGYDGDIVDCRGANLDIDIRKNSQLERMDVYHENVIRHAANAVLSSRTIIARFDGATIHRTANSTIPKMHALPSKDLKIYMFNNSNINAIGSSILKFCDQIEYVTLSHNNIRTIFFDTLFVEHYPKLIEFDISYNALSRIEAAEKQRRAVPNLKILRLNNNNFTKLNSFIEGSSNYSAMEAVYIGGNPWKYDESFVEWVLENKEIIADIDDIYFYENVIENPESPLAEIPMEAVDGVVKIKFQILLEYLSKDNPEPETASTDLQVSTTVSIPTDEVKTWTLYVIISVLVLILVVVVIVLFICWSRIKRRFHPVNQNGSKHITHSTSRSPPMRPLPKVPEYFISRDNLAHQSQPLLTAAYCRRNDVFVIHGVHPEDCNLVNNYIVPLFNNEDYTYRVVTLGDCVPRNTINGAMVFDNCEVHMRQSFIKLLVLTEHFLRDDWPRKEIQKLVLAVNPQELLVVHSMNLQNAQLNNQSFERLLRSSVCLNMTDVTFTSTFRFQVEEKFRLCAPSPFNSSDSTELYYSDEQPYSIVKPIIDIKPSQFV